jgi:hypothetical protein
MNRYLVTIADCAGVCDATFQSDMDLITFSRYVIARLTIGYDSVTVEAI